MRHREFRSCSAPPLEQGRGRRCDSADVARHFQGVCLLCCTEGDSRERILSDIATADKYFEYFSVNVFCENQTAEHTDKTLAKWFTEEIYPELFKNPKAEVLLHNTDLGVG